MTEYIATFYTHYGAVEFKKHAQAQGICATQMPVPRKLSSSCGTCVRFFEKSPGDGTSAENSALPVDSVQTVIENADGQSGEFWRALLTEDVEQVVMVKDESYVSLYEN